MKTYKIKTIHDICLDDYKQGELEFVNIYSLDSEIGANSTKEAIKKYFNEFLYYSIDFKYIQIDNNILNYSVLVDVDNNEVTNKDIIYKKWVEGKEKLYSNNITLFAYEIKECELINL